MKINICMCQFLLCGLVALALTSAARAADYSAGMIFAVGGKHDDNIRFVQTVPEFKLSAATESTLTELDSRFSFNRFDKSEFNSDDQDIDLSFVKGFETSSLKLDANVVRDSTLTSELLGTGRIGTKAERRELYSFSPSWTYALDENDQIALGASYQNVDYHSTQYIGYHSWDVSLTWTHAFTERLDLQAVTTHSEYRSDDGITQDVPNQNLIINVFGALLPIAKGQFGQQTYFTENKNDGIQIGAGYKLTETSNLTALVGFARSKTDYPLKDPNNDCGNGFRRGFTQFCFLTPQEETAPTATLAWNWKGERQDFQLSASKARQPSGDGFIVDATQVALTWSFNLAELHRLSFDFSGTRNRSLASSRAQANTASIDRDYASATLGYHYQWSENWFIDTTYRYAYQNYTDTDNAANSRVVTLGVRYQPTQWHWSR